MTIAIPAGAAGRLLSLLASTVLLAGCGGEEPVEPDTSPPDLTGTYDLVSISALVTGGVVMTPPDVTGTFTLRQSAVTGDQATGTLSMNLVIPDGLGGTQNIVDEGTFTVRTDGTWEQAGQLIQAKGTYSLAGSTLTVDVTEPAISIATTIWERR